MKRGDDGVGKHNIAESKDDEKVTLKYTSVGTNEPGTLAPRTTPEFRTLFDTGTVKSKWVLAPRDPILQALCSFVFVSDRTFTSRPLAPPSSACQQILLECYFRYVFQLRALFRLLVRRTFWFHGRCGCHHIYRITCRCEILPEE